MFPTRFPDDPRTRGKRMPLRKLGLALIAACALGANLPAAAATISSLGVALGGGNSADLFDDTGATRQARQSAVGVQSSSATSFSTRYQMGVGAETSAVFSSLTVSHTASYTITFQVDAAAGEAWQLVISTSRAGALTLVSDSPGSASASLGAVTGTTGGAGSLSSGSLGVGAVTTLGGGSGGNTPFSQTSAAVIMGVGTGVAQSVTLSFGWAASATSSGVIGDEGAVRMGVDSALSGFSADNYPGVGGRTLGNDGHLVSVLLTPEPGTSALIALGLSGLALRRSRRSGSEYWVEGSA